MPGDGRQCGYTSGRARSAASVVDLHEPDERPYAESIPPADPMVTRTARTCGSLTRSRRSQGYVTQAEQNGGGWVQLVFHDLCATSCAGDDYSTTPALFNALLDWLQPRAAANGTVVKTVAQVMSGG